MTTLPSRSCNCCGMTSRMSSSQRARTIESAPAIASSTDAAAPFGPSSSASACAFEWSLAATTTDSPPATRCRAMAPPMLPTPTIAVVSGIVDLLGEQPEGLIGADPVDGLPVFGDEAVLDAEEVGRHEVGGFAVLGDRAVPDASRGDAVVLGAQVRLEGPAIGHRTAADPQSAGGRVAAVRRPS